MLALVLGALPAAAARAQPAAEPHRAHLTSDPVRIDGRLDEPVWAAGRPIPLPFEWFPGDNVAPPVATECRIAFDDDALYLGCRAEDPAPDAIRARYADRDVIGEDDRLVVLLDPFGDRRSAFRFAVNPLGEQADALVLQGGDADPGWDTIWDAAARIDAAGWTAELAIPFHSLRFPPDGEAAWGLVLERAWPRGSDRLFGNVRLPRDENCLLCRAAALAAPDHATPGRDLELVPSLTALRTDRRTDLPDGPLETGDPDVEVGLTARWGLTSSFTLAATANPDFSQVEADADQLDVNTRFALEFPERRPFFLERVDVFENAGNLDLVFTRTVADPEAGLKLTGKVSRHAIGAFATRDRVNNLVLPGSQSSDEVSLDIPVTGAIARYRADVGRSSTVGALFTTRLAEGYANHVAAVDGFLRPTSRQRVRFLLAASRTEYPAALAGEGVAVDDPFADRSWFARWDYDGRIWGAEFSWRDVGPDFRADAGFVPRVGLRGPEAQVRRTFWGDDRPGFDRIDLVVDGQELVDADGDLVERKLGLQAGYRGPAQSELEVEIARRRERFAERLFDLVTGEISATVRPSAVVALEASLELGDEIDADRARRADLVDLEVGAALRPGRRLRIDGSYRYQRLSLDGETFLSAHVPQGRVEFHLGPRTFVRGILQFRSVREDPLDRQDRGEPDDERRLFAQILFSWRANARTVAFVGYSDEGRGASSFDVTRTDRTLFLKVAYAWRR